VMVIGAAGGVGSYAVQLARSFGAHVTGVCGPAKAELVRSLGAEDVIDYTRADVDSRGARYDVIIDTAGNRPLSLLRRALTPRGTLAIVGGGHADAAVLGGLDRLLRAGFLSMVVGQRLRGVMARAKAADLDELRGLIESGSVTPVIDRTYDLAAAPEAISYLAEGHPAGKVVVTVR
jgi:NADPH:quinone reductase-like Zn-dependent oxidoreductase